jgi:hypothetical protein
MVIHGVTMFTEMHTRAIRTPLQLQTGGNCTRQVQAASGAPDVPVSLAAAAPRSGGTLFAEPLGLVQFLTQGNVSLRYNVWVIGEAGECPASRGSLQSAYSPSASATAE